MEKENKEIMENTEQKENNNEKKEQSDQKKSNRKKILWITLGIVLVLCLGIFIFIRINMTETHVYEEIENLAEREEICFDNLLLSSTIGLYNNSSEEMELRYLCIFNTGDIYSFEWSELTPWDWYYWGDEVGHERGYDDSIWSRAEDVAYLGKLSNWEIFYLNRYVANYDIGGEYYNVMETGPLVPVNDEENRQEHIEEQDISRTYLLKIYWHEQPEKDIRKDTVIEGCEINYLDNNTYEKGEILWESYEENAIAVSKLFEFSGFYDRWVSMCLNNG